MQEQASNYLGKRHLKVKKKDNPAVPRIISNNHITLLQNGEAYFPAIQAALDRAVHEIYLESYYHLILYNSLFIFS